jgi:hypothetical protein
MAARNIAGKEWFAYSPITFPDRYATITVHNRTDNYPNRYAIASLRYQTYTQADHYICSYSYICIYTDANI